MRLLAFVGVLGSCLTLSGQGLSASSDEPGDGQDDGRLTILGDQVAGMEVPSILRGSAIARKAPAPEPAVGAPTWRLLAGRRLWLVDPTGREVVACNLEQTTQVGLRIVRCFEGDLPASIARD